MSLNPQLADEKVGATGGSGSPLAINGERTEKKAKPIGKNAVADGAGPMKAYSVGAEVPEGTRRLHLNEFRFDHPFLVLSAIKGAYDALGPEVLLTRYSAGDHPELLRRLAGYVGWGAEPRNVTAAAGSDEILRAVIDTCGLRGHRRILMVVPGYTHFEHYVRLRGLEVVALPTVGPTMALEPRDQAACLHYHRAMLAEGCLVYLCSPNNPTGDIWQTDVLRDAATRYPKSLFLVDEAYIEFASADIPPDEFIPAETTDAQLLNRLSAVPVALEMPNVLVARTLSKAFGLAALRIGYAVARAETIESLKVAVSPKALSVVASTVACAALAEVRHYAVFASIARANARNLLKWLRASGRVCFDGRGNFILVHVGDDAAKVCAALSAAGIQVRDRSDLPSLNGFVRVTVGGTEDALAVEHEFNKLPVPAQPPIQLLYTPKGQIAAVKEMLRTVVRVLDAARVKSWAQGGTMLGLARCGGILPHDDDADLAYARPLDGGDPVANLKEAFAAEGLALQRNRTGAYWQIGSNKSGETISPTHVDLFSYSLVVAPGAEEGRWLLDDPRFRDEAPESAGAHCNTQYSHDELYPLKEAPFYDFKLRMPNKSEQVLARALGPNWRTEARVRTADANANNGADAAHVAYRVSDKTPA